MTQEYWNECFTYDAETGSLIWKERPLHHFKGHAYMTHWNGRHFGKIAGTYNEKWGNYIRVSVLGKDRGIHRIIWEMHNGLIPPKMTVDHINGNSTDNRIENLRLATHPQNTRNSKISKRNTSGYKGVSQCRVSGQWKAYITLNLKRTHLGYFSSVEEAYEAYCEASKRLHGEFGRLG